MTAGGDALSCVKFAPWRFWHSDFEGILMLTAPPCDRAWGNCQRGRRGGSPPKLSRCLVNPNGVAGALVGAGGESAGRRADF